MSAATISHTAFYLNGQWEEVVDHAPSLTLLRYLRNTKTLTGTKEGCGSGDCGACTVIVGQNSGQEWTFQTANSCILLVAQLAGKAVLTVEALASNKQLHPAQQAMVDCHGSQCGFCTPGFVMSLAALHRQHPEGAEREEILEALSGNLCRCTGYQPIVEAAKSMNQYAEDVTKIWSPTGPDDEPGRGEVNWVQPAKLAASSKAFAVQPRSLEELIGFLSSHPDAQLVAGSTDLGLEVTQKHLSLNKVIYLGNVAELQEIRETRTRLEIGSVVTFSELELILNRCFPEFGAMLKRLGSRQIRNQGTVGGNIGNASPIGDTPPVLMALGADLILNGPNGERTLPIEEFFLGYKQTALSEGEFIAKILVPKLNSDTQLKVYKISKRIEDDISTVLMALKLEVREGKVQDIRVAFGGMAAVPARAKAVESALLNNSYNLATFEAAAKMVGKDFKPMSDVRATASYRAKVAENLLIKCGLELCANEQVTVVDLKRVQHA